MKFRIFDSFHKLPSVLPEQNDRYPIQPWKMNEIKAYKKYLTPVLTFWKNGKIMAECNKNFREPLANFKETNRIFWDVLKNVTKKLQQFPRKCREISEIWENMGNIKKIYILAY